MFESLDLILEESILDIVGHSLVITEVMLV
jgi:hypothetical protein